MASHTFGPSASPSTSSAQALLNKGKRGAAAHIYAECTSATSKNQHLNDLLDILLNPSKTIDDWETIDWCKWLMAGGRTPDEFSNTVRQYNNATKCGLVWTPNFIAYRCRTCAISPCMALCTDCFKNGHHDSHDFNMFLSQAGGACDCGDTSVMKDTGFCHRHGPTTPGCVDKSPVPKNLMSVAEAMMPRMILRLIQHLRENYKIGVIDHRTTIQYADSYLQMLLDLNYMGALMRHVMTATLTNPQQYKYLMNPDDDDEDDNDDDDDNKETATTSSTINKCQFNNYHHDNHNAYYAAIKSLPNPEPPDDYKNCPSLQENLIHSTFLEELMFWTVAYEFPQKIVCLLLNMLPDPDYKEALTRAFVLHYSRIAMMLEKSSDPDTLSNRVVHVSVQLFSNEALALRMVDELKLLHVMVISLKYMMSKILIENTLHTVSKNFHYVVDCGKQVMKEHCYWPIVSDLNNVLSHQPVAIRFLSDDSLLEMWFDFLSMFQGMNVNKREMQGHVEYEPNTYYAAFSAELEASAYPMWALVSHLRGPETSDVSKNALKYCLAALRDWLDAIGFESPDICDLFNVSFHLPLHRYFSVIMCQAIRQQNIKLEELLPSDDMLHLLMIHPLRVQVTLYEILNGLWVRNGVQIKGQAMTYIQCNFCNSMVDADLYLLQICATKLQPDIFLNTVIDKFHVNEWLSLRTVRSRNNIVLIGEHDTAMMESFLIFLSTLINVRTNLGLTDTEISHLEMVTLLCMGDKTHSQLVELMPERCGTTPNRDFESILANVAQFRTPNLDPSIGSMPQGMYAPKPKVWDELYDPLHVLLRAVHRKDYQISMDRFTESAKKSLKIDNNTTQTLWPPFRYPSPVSPNYDDPRIVLRTKIFHSIIFSVLYKAVNDHNITEHVMALAVYLMEMAVVTADYKVNDKVDKPLCPYTGPYNNDDSCGIKDSDFSRWYDGDSLVENLKTIIPRTNTVDNHPTDLSPDWENGSDITENPLMLNDEFDVEIGEQGEIWDLELHDGRVDADDHRSQSALMETASLPALLPSNDATNEWGLTIVQNPSEDDDAPMQIGQQRALPPPNDDTLSLMNEGTMLALTNPQEEQQQPSGNEVDLLQVIFPRLGANANTPNVSQNHTTQIASSSTNSRDVVPSTSSSHHHHHHHHHHHPHHHHHHHHHQHQHQQQQQHQHSHEFSCRENIQKPGESIISLLLKLHSKLSGVPDSFNYDEDDNNLPGSSKNKNEKTFDKESRIGDGPFFISKLLNKISNLDKSLKENIIDTKNRLWPKTKDCEDEQKERELREREERRKRAKERQQKLMADIANQQKQFMKTMEQTDEAGMDWDPTDTTTQSKSEKTYHCVICSQVESSTDDKPMGLVVLVQSTSVVGHERKTNERLNLPTSDDDDKIPHDDTRGAHFDTRIDELNRHFDTFSWLLSVNIGWEGGVHVQTCGHNIHLECLKSYRAALRDQQRQQSLAVDRGEYLCPLCRQLANSVLPMSPQLGECSSIVRSRHASSLTILAELNNFFKEIQRNPETSNLSVAMGKAMEEMTASTYLKYKQKNCQPSHQSLFLFVTSVARTNFEVEIVQRGGTLTNCSDDISTSSSTTTTTNNLLTPKRDCIVALLHVLAMHARVLTNWPVDITWQQLSGLPSDHPATQLALTSHEREVPLLLRDPTSLLIQFCLLLPLHIDQTYFSTVVKVIYNLLYYQVLVQVSCTLTKKQRQTIGKDSNNLQLSSEIILRNIIDHLDINEFYNDDDGIVQCTIKTIEQQIQLLCLPFLRVAALLRHHLYSQQLPQIRTQKNEFLRLVYYLELVTEGMKPDSFNSAVALNWQDNDTSINVPKLWCDQFLSFYGRSQIAGKRLIIDQHISWQAPKLLNLPREYEKLFTYYHEKQCCKCHSVPPEISICLLCGTIVCLKQNCCKQQNVGEAVQHSIDCGGGTGIYLVVTSTYIIVIRGRRACLWGSLYLDDFEEEDKDLKRGKPLYLSKDRYQLLEQQWLAHRFDHTKKTWVWHRDAL